MQNIKYSKRSDSCYIKLTKKITARLSDHKKNNRVYSFAERKGSSVSPMPSISIEAENFEYADIIVELSKHSYEFDSNELMKEANIFAKEIGGKAEYSYQQCRKKAMVWVEKNFTEGEQGYNIVVYNKMTKEMLHFTKAKGITQMVEKVRELLMEWDRKFIIEQMAIKYNFLSKKNMATQQSQNALLPAHKRSGDFRIINRGT